MRGVREEEGKMDKDGQEEKIAQKGQGNFSLPKVIKIITGQVSKTKQYSGRTGFSVDHRSEDLNRRQEFRRRPLCF